MADYATEEEQLEALKRWWKENGRSVVLGATIGVLALAGWRGWEMYQEQQSLEASALYDRIESVAAYDDVGDIAEQLRGEYVNTPYAALAALRAAAAAADEGDLSAAADWLDWARQNGDNPAVTALARLRMARVLVEQGENGRALDLLEAEVPQAYNGLYAALRGDILAEQGDIEAALTAYQRALDAEVGPVDSTLIERRINRLRGQVATGSGDAEADPDS